VEIVDDDKTTHVQTSVGNDLDLLAERALEFVQPGSTVGLGSGRAARVFVRVLGRRAQRGLTITCVATSEVTARLAAEVGLRAVKLDETPLDLTVDGADEVDPDLNALKGFGGALVRERIVAAASRRQILLIRAEKLVPALGSGGRLPVEVLPFAVRFCVGKLRQLGFAPEVRQEGGRPLVTDSGNFTLDCETAPLADPAMTKRAIDSIPGVVDTGLFLGPAERVLVANGGCVRELRRKGR
jgi:ribose 5-phosphate isomerase A